MARAVASPDLLSNYRFWSDLRQFDPEGSCRAELRRPAERRGKVGCRGNHVAKKTTGLGLLGGLVLRFATVMVTVQIDLPEEAFSALRKSPAERAGELRLASAIHYARGLISQELAAEIAGLDRADFILALARGGVDAFTVDMDSIRRELADS